MLEGKTKDQIVLPQLVNGEKLFADFSFHPFIPGFFWSVNATKCYKNISRLISPPTSKEKMTFTLVKMEISLILFLKFRKTVSSRLRDLVVCKLKDRQQHAAVSRLVP
jgi:hypothetical protein